MTGTYEPCPVDGHWWAGEDACERPKGHKGLHRSGVFTWDDDGREVVQQPVSDHD